MSRTIRDRAERAAFVAIARAHAAAAFAERFLAELPVVLFDSPALERWAALRHYEAASAYRAPEAQQAGLHGFEARALAGFFPPAPAKLLVPGAGAGREALALGAMGYQVDALEPTAGLADAAHAAMRPPSRVRRMTVQEWASLDGAACDGVVAGWEMWSHLVRQADRLAVLRAFRAACPTGPVLLSFFTGDVVFDALEGPSRLEPLHPPPTTRLEQVARGWLRERVLGRGPVERGTGWTRAMLVHHVTEAELREEAAATGWEVAHFERGERFRTLSCGEALVGPPTWA